MMIQRMGGLAMRSLRKIFAALVVMAMGTGPVAAFDLQLEGAQGDLQNALYDASRLAGLAPQNVTSSDQVLAAAKADYAGLLGALQARGHFAAQVRILLDGASADGLYPVDLNEAPQNVRVLIQAGPQFQFGRVEVGPLPAGFALPQGLRAGAAALPDQIETGVQAAIAAWRDAGHIRARAGVPIYTADHRRNVLNIRVPIVPGGAFQVGELSPSTASDVTTPALQAIAGLPTGAALTPQVLSDGQKRLVRSGAFRFVTLSPGAGRGPVLPITANVQDEKPRRIGFGAGFATTDGLNLDGFFLHRNLRGGAERLRLWASLSGVRAHGGIDSTIGARLAKPAFIGSDVTGFAQIEAEQTKDPLAQTHDLSVQGGLQYTPVDKAALQYGGAVQLSRTLRQDALVDRRDCLLSAPIYAQMDRRNGRGVYAAISVEPFVQSSRAGAGLSGQVDLRGLWRFGRRLGLAALAQYTSVIGPDLTQTPARYLVYSGGASTVRGHDYNSLGVITSGVETGGRARILARGELRVDLPGAWGGNVFYDWARVSAQAMPDWDDPFHSGAGIGISYDTGFAPLRLDIATPLAGGDHGVALYLGIGQAF